MWFDFSYDEMYGEKWGATKLVEMVRTLQPGILIDDRLNKSDEKTEGEEEPPYAGDFVSPEQMIPNEGMVDSKGRPLPWEACLTLNDNWGYAAYDKNYKSAKTVIRMLVECVSKGGNLLLNVGPNAKGEIPKESVAILEEVADWMHDNSESIYGCGQCELSKPEWGRYTQNGRYIYAHIYDINPAFRLPGLQARLKGATLLSDGSEIDISRPWNSFRYPDDAFLNLSAGELPDPYDTVVRLELED